MTETEKLKNIMSQIQKILVDNDVAGVVVLHTPGFSEYMLHITPSYSCIKIESMNGIRFRCTADQFGGDTKKRDEMIANTSNMLHHLSAVCDEKCVVPLSALSKKIDEVTGSEHTDPGSEK